MKFLAAAAAAVILSSSAFGQQAPDTGATAPNPTPAKGASPFITNQGQDQWLAGNLWNKNVFNAAGQPIGALKDVLVDREGKVVAVIVGAGGFLGLGEKNVAIDYDFLKQNGGISGDRIVIGMTEQDLRAAPDFHRARPATANNGGSRNQ
jgi:sporulation protein YlmC with PRC-barrel domain